MDIQLAIAALVDSVLRDFSFPLGGSKYPIPTSEERTLFDAFKQLDDCDDIKLGRIRDGLKVGPAYTIVVFALRMALAAFRNRDSQNLSRAASPLLLVASKIDWRDLLGAVSLYADGCRRIGLDPLETLTKHRRFAAPSAWETIESGFFGRNPDFQAPEVFGMDPFDYPHSFLYANLKSATNMD